jgi:hypothetical protein
MSKTEILDELPRLSAEERREIFERLWALQKQDTHADGPTPEEMELLDRESEEFERNPDDGMLWSEFYESLRNSLKK